MIANFCHREESIFDNNPLGEHMFSVVFTMHLVITIQSTVFQVRCEQVSISQLNSSLLRKKFPSAIIVERLVCRKHHNEYRDV